jgi:hypothetical protein
MGKLAVYEIEEQKRSLVLNNFEFHNRKYNLSGGPRIGFQVELKENKTAEEMQHIMIEYAEKYYSDTYCFLCVFISRRKPDYYCF